MTTLSTVVLFHMKFSLSTTKLLFHISTSRYHFISMEMADFFLEQKETLANNPLISTSIAKFAASQLWVKPHGTMVNFSSASLCHCSIKNALDARQHKKKRLSVCDVNWQEMKTKIRITVFPHGRHRERICRRSARQEWRSIYKSDLWLSQC